MVYPCDLCMWFMQCGVLSSAVVNRLEYQSRSWVFKSPLGQNNFLKISITPAVITNSLGGGVE